jgi:hypothetical protein
MILGGLIQNAEIEGGLPAISTLLTRIESLSDDQRNKLLKKRWTYPSPSTTDFLGMLELFREHATGDYRKEILRSSMSVWARSDPNAAGHWLAKQSPSDDRDEMITGYAKRVVGIDPERAAAWVARRPGRPFDCFPCRKSEAPQELPIPAIHLCDDGGRPCTSGRHRPLAAASHHRAVLPDLRPSGVHCSW